MYPGGVSVWDRADAAGHNFTLITNMVGVGLYYCERCSSLMFLSNQTVEVWHAPPGSAASLELCQVRDLVGKSLKDKLTAMQERDLERLKNI